MTTETTMSPHIFPIVSEGRTLKAVFAELTARVRELVPAFAGESFSPGLSWQRDGSELWPERYAWIACYAVRGGSEGYYVHLDAIMRPSREDDLNVRDSLSLTFVKLWNFDDALEVARVCTRLLDWT